jgi:hypothetical protein
VADHHGGDRLHRLHHLPPHLRRLRPARPVILSHLMGQFSRKPCVCETIKSENTADDFGTVL